MSYLVICAVAFIASGLTFFSGFGLGTLLLPPFALFFPVGEAVALTSVVHGPNGVFKLVLVRRSTDRRVLLRFGAPAVAALLAGALLLARLAEAPPLITYEFADNMRAVTPVKLAIGGLLLVFGSLELSGRFRRLAIPPRYLPIGGLLSGFFGGLSGMQGALRSAFLVRAGLTKDAFIGTGVAIAVLIDVSRLGVYIPAFVTEDLGHDRLLLAAAVASAFAGAALGNRYVAVSYDRCNTWLAARAAGVLRMKRRTGSSTPMPKKDRCGTAGRKGSHCIRLLGYLVAPTRPCAGCLSSRVGSDRRLAVDPLAR